jgi:hypothetical protein
MSKPKKKPKPKPKPHKFGRLVIPPDAIVRDGAAIVTEKSQLDECRLPGTETDGTEEEDE